MSLPNLNYLRRFTTLPENCGLVLAKNEANVTNWFPVEGRTDECTTGRGCTTPRNRQPLGLGNFCEVYQHPVNPTEVIKSIYYNPLKNPRQQRELSANFGEYMSRHKELYDLCLESGIPVAPSRFYIKGELSTITQSLCHPVAEVEPCKIEVLTKILERMAELWSLGIFVLFDPSSNNIMRHDGVIVMTDFGGDRDDSNFMSGESLCLNLYSILLKGWNLKPEQLYLLLGTLHESITKNCSVGLDENGYILKCRNAWSEQEKTCLKLYHQQILPLYYKTVRKTILEERDSYINCIIKQLESCMKLCTANCGHLRW